ncbi:MAG: DNA-directed RNA polymerase subunit beta, partial [Clostridia bacterium]|nr:DNA-directed RNA polymerase subunit beta [Clostridia bacterium]
MVKPVILGKNKRMSFSKINEPIEMPNLLEIQKDSYEWFVKKGLAEVLEDVSPIVDYSGKLAIEFIGYSIDSTPKYPVEECKDRDVNYAAPLRVDVRLTNRETGEVKQSEIFMGDFPIMTETGTFVINGAERVIVSQIVRSPGIYFDSTIDKTAKHIFTSTVIPYRGAWLEYETDASDVFYVRIDKNHKLPVTMLIRAMGVESRDEIDAMFGVEPMIAATLEKDKCDVQAIEYNTSVRDEALKEIYKKLRPGEPAIVESAEILINNLFFDPKRYDLAPVGRFKYDKKLALAYRIRGLVLSRPAVNPITGEVLDIECGKPLTREDAREIERNCVNEVYVLDQNGVEVKVFSNNAVFAEDVLGYDISDTDASEKVQLPVLLSIMEEAGDDKEEVKRLCRARMAELCPKHIIREDILSSINYLLCLTHDIG